MNAIELINIIHFMISSFFFIIFLWTVGIIYYHCVYKFKQTKIPCPPPSPVIRKPEDISIHPDSPYNGLNGIPLPDTIAMENNLINNNI